MTLRFLPLIGLAALAATATAGPQNFGTRFQEIRAGVVVLDGDRPDTATFPRSAAPFAFYNLDANPRLKPTGWTFLNPLAPSLFSLESAARWNALDAAGGGPGVAVGDRITKADAAYWEVRLSQLSEDALTRYDVLLVAPRYIASLNPAEREKLRRFADAGGVVWVDLGYCLSAPDPVNNFPISFGLLNSPNNRPAEVDGTQPLVRYPNQLGYRDFLNLQNQDGVPRRWAMQPTPVPGGLSGVLGHLSRDFRSYQVVTSTNNQATTAFAAVGDGFFVVTTRGAAGKLSSTVTDVTPDTNFRLRGKNPVLGATGISAGRFAVNVVALASQFRQQGGGSRRSNSSGLGAGAPLLRRFTTAQALPDSSADTPPVIYKGVAIVSVNDHLEAYDVDPQADLDNDGRADDGLPDLTTGGTQDLLWRSAPMPGPISAPAALEVANPAAGDARDQVGVVDQNGTLHVFAVFNPGPDGRIVGGLAVPERYNVPAPDGTATLAGRTPPAPTAHEGIFYVADSVTVAGSPRGRVWAASALLKRTLRSGDAGGRPFVLGGDSSALAMPEFSAGPTVGYIPIFDNSGGADLVMYLPTRPQSPGTPNPAATAGVTSLWIGARGEKPIEAQVDGSALVVTTRASQQGALPIWFPPAGGNSAYLPRISVIDAAGNPWTAGRLATYFSAPAINAGAGVISFPFRTGAPAWPTNVSVRVDYTIDWGGTDGETNLIRRGQLNLPDAANERSVVGPVALSPRGTMHLVLSSGIAGNGGAYFAFREEGRGLFRMVSRYDLYGPHTRRVNGAAVQQAEVLFDRDPVNGFLPFGPNPDDRRLRNFAFRSGPSIRNGIAYVAARAEKTLTVPPFGRVPSPTTILMAFNAEPPTPEIPVGTGLPDGSVLVQQDLLRSADRTAPDQESTLQAGQYTYDPERGVIRVDNLMNVQNGAVNGALTLSEPVIVRRPDGGDTSIEPDAVSGGRWSPLLWYVIQNGTDIPTAPPGTSQPSSAVLATASAVYVSGESRLPNILAGAGINNVGVIGAYDAQVAQNDPSLVADSVRPWVKQLWTIALDGGNLRGSNHVLWPQLNGITTFDDFIVRLNQAVIPGSATSFGVVSGDNTAIAWGPGGLSAFTRADVVVADANRIGVFDPSGNAIFTTDATVTGGVAGEGGAVNVRPLVRPSRAYGAGGNGLLIADPGANRVVRMGNDGVEQRSIERFVLDPTIVPTGYRTGDPLTLSGPRDVATWSQFVFLGGAAPSVTGQAAVEFWTHYLIADTGNRRLVELIDRQRVDPNTREVLDPVRVNGAPQLGVLVWHSPADVSGGKFAYHSVTRLYVPASGALPERSVYVAGIGDAQPTTATFGLDLNNNTGGPASTGDGGFVVFDAADPQPIRVVDRITLPDRTATPFWYRPNPQTAGQWLAAGAIPDPAERRRQLGNRAAGERLFNGVSAVTARVVPFVPSGGGGVVPGIAAMVSCNDGIYEVTFAPGFAPTFSWMLPEQAFVHLRRDGTGRPSQRNPAGFRPSYARRLDSGEILIVNAYTGVRLSDQATIFGSGVVPPLGATYLGEVVQLDGSPLDLTAQNLGFRLSSVRYELPPIQGTRGLIQPLFADRR